MSIKQKTVEIQKSIETGARGPLAHFDTRTYIQHNLALPDGFAALLAFLDSLPPGTSRVRPLRAFEDDDISFAHLEYALEPMGELVGFEVHRWENGRIVEHWDNLQPVAPRLNPSSRSMTDGRVEASDPGSADDNKRVIERLVRDVYIAGDHDLLTDLVAEHLIEHNPNRGDGIGELRAALTRPESIRYEGLHRVLGEGDFCLAMSEGFLNGDHTAFYDLFRLEAGRVVEHWDVVEPIPPRATWANDNGKF